LYWREKQKNDQLQTAAKWFGGIRCYTYDQEIASSASSRITITWRLCEKYITNTKIDAAFHLSKAGTLSNSLYGWG